MPIVEDPMFNTLLPFVTLILFAPILLRPTAPVKEFALVSVIACAPALSVTAPALAAWVIAPVCVIPAPVSVSVPDPTEDAAKLNAVPVLFSVTLFAPVLVRATAPVNALI